jgi:hypothetical protein
MTRLSPHRIRVNRLPILLGLCGLVLGLLVYLASRPPESTYFIWASGLKISLYNRLPDLFGWLGDILPAFLHPFSFSLLTAGVLGCRGRKILYTCAIWFVVDFAFELGQKYSVWTSSIVPEVFVGVPVLENAKEFFARGTFDPLDIAAMGVGCFAAYFVLVLTVEKKAQEERSHQRSTLVSSSLQANPSSAPLFLF